LYFKREKNLLFRNVDTYTRTHLHTAGSAEVGEVGKTRTGL